MGKSLTFSLGRCQLMTLTISRLQASNANKYGVDQVVKLVDKERANLEVTRNGIELEQQSLRQKQRWF
ncbi:unnamed protein product [Lactuca virosa]|uniref:Uncharacterized protein n=1 Tax=Lactuca virosa TaxID=75947 RepID=A0AAU9M6J7_9ASTR|nr:unnamed protein product [Lactuca virosa]